HYKPKKIQCTKVNSFPFRRIEGQSGSLEVGRRGIGRKKGSSDDAGFL
ncbi:unnamed protein product, partial [Linum tenue]